MADLNWNADFSTMPTDGTRVALRREDCPGYDTTGAIRNGRLEVASLFIRPDMQVFSRPTHWRPLEDEHD